VATMNQKSSLREGLQFVSQVLTANSPYRKFDPLALIATST
jgi:hypothetical protein